MDKQRKSKTTKTVADEGARPEQTTPLSPVDVSKVSAPRSGSGVVSRERLQARLLDARRCRCIVVKGPAGCGKTTALVSWRQALLPLRFDVAWLTLTTEDNQLARFLDYLLACIARVDPALVADAALLEGYSNDCDSDAVERTVVTLAQAIARHPRELVLVLDDVHTLTDVSIHQTLQWLIDYAPANLHLVLVSRSSLPFSLARLRSQNLMLELDLQDLRFSAAEAEHFLKAQLDSISAQEIQLIYEMTDGWIAGLQLVAASRKKSRKKIDVLNPDLTVVHAQVRDNKAFSDFFKAEVLSQLAPTDLELLLHMTVCNRFCASLCAALVGREDAIGEAASLLSRLESDNLFLIAIDNGDSEKWFRFHPLLRETLLKIFLGRSDAEQRAVHARAWRWFCDNDQLGEAIGHAVQGGEAAAAALVVEQRVEGLYARGDLRMLIELVRQLPVEQVHASIKLRMLLVRIQTYARDFDAAALSIAGLERDVPLSDTETRFRVVMLGAILAVQRDDTDSAMTLLPHLLNPPKEADALMIGGSTNILSWLYMHRGEYERARQIQLERPQLLVEGKPFLGTAGGSLQGRCLIGLSLTMQGQMTQAERIYREVIYEAELGGKTCSDAYYLATALLGEVLYEIGEVEAAYQLLVNRVDIFERVSIPDSVLRVLEVLGKCQWLAGHHREAFAYLERLDEYSRRLGLDRLQAFAMAWQIHWHLQLGELVDAETKIARLDAIDARHPNAQLSALGSIHILAENAHVRWEAAGDDLHSAAIRLNHLITYCQANDRQLGVNRLKMLGAVFDDQRGLTESAQTKVLDVLRSGQRFGQVRSLLDAHPTALALINRVQQTVQLDPLLAFYVERLQTAALSACAAAPAEPTRKPGTRWQPVADMDPLSERELGILRLLAQALPNKKIARALGLSPETVKWHLKNIFGKLEVSSRDEAVARLRGIEEGSQNA